jgi:tetratricopeptide (TPR) repeat protein
MTHTIHPWARWIAWSAMVLFPLPVLAQGLQAQREEVQVAPVDDLPDVERGQALETARSGPEQVRASEFEETVGIEVVERQGVALDRLRNLVRDTPATDSQRPNYMFRLAELYYDLSRYYEQRGFGRRDEAFETRALNPQRARALEENAVADIQQADLFADNAIEIYAQIYTSYADSYPDIDAVLYYLGVNMLQRERNEEARVIFEELAAQYPRSAYLPQALLMLGELDFAEGYMDSALRYYNDVALNPDSSVYPYALYKRSWCYYNLSQGPEGFEQALQGLYDAVVAVQARIDSGENRSRLRRDILRDMTLFYSEIFGADTAVDFFTELAPDMAFDLIARLARIYGDKGLYRDSTSLYRELIAQNSQSLEVIGYQYEIVNNTRPSAVQADIVRELTRLVELYLVAESFADHNPARVQAWGQDIERMLRVLALTYYREAQTTRNEQFYALAYELFEDYLRIFEDSDAAYQMWFLYAELLYYHREEFMEAARAYEQAMIRSNGQGEYDEMATYNACRAYLRLVDVASQQAVDSGNAMTSSEEDLPPMPEPSPISEDYQRMMSACDLYLGTSPSQEDAVQIEFITAYMYYTFHHLDEAAQRFGHLATTYGGVDPERARLSAVLLLDSLAVQRKFEEMKEWIDRLRAMPLMNEGELGAQLAVLSERIDFKRCRDMQTTGRHVEAGYCYYDFVETHYASELIDRAFYNAAVAFEDGNRLGESLLANQYLIQYVPNSDLVPETTFLLGQTYYRMALFEEAAGYYEQYVAATPRGEQVRRALINASICRQGLGQYRQALDNLRAFIRYNDEGDPEQARAIAEANWSIAETYRMSGDANRAGTQYEAIIRDFGAVLPSRAMESHVRLAEMQLERGVADRALQWFSRATAYWDGLSAEAQASFEPAGRDAAARSRFVLGDEIFREFDGVQLRGNEAQLQAAFLRKQELAQQAEQAFSQVIPIGSPGWSVASFTRVGELYRTFYQQVIDSPVPSDLTPIQAEEYQTLIEERAELLKDMAMTMFGNAIETARAAGYFSEFAQRAASLYQELDPTFRAGSEMVVAPDHASFRWFQSGFVTDLPSEGDESSTRQENPGADAVATHHDAEVR